MQVQLRFCGTAMRARNIFERQLPVDHRNQTHSRFGRWQLGLQPSANYDFFEVLLRLRGAAAAVTAGAVFCRFVGSITTKSARSHVKGGRRRRSVCRRSRFTAADPSVPRRSSVRRSQVTRTGSSVVRVFNASNRRIAPRRTTISIADSFRLVVDRRFAEFGSLSGIVRLRYRSENADSLMISPIVHCENLDRVSIALFNIAADSAARPAAWSSASNSYAAGVVVAATVGHVRGS